MEEVTPGIVSLSRSVSDHISKNVLDVTDRKVIRMRRSTELDDQ